MPGATFAHQRGEILMVVSGERPIRLDPDQCSDLMEIYTCEIAAAVRHARDFQPAAGRRHSLKLAINAAKVWQALGSNAPNEKDAA